jgi:cyclopropane-fatty-acyl-phospholipid synthase
MMMPLLQSMLAKFVQTGKLTIIDAKGRSSTHQGAPGPEVTVRLTDPKLARSLLFNPELRAGEAYMDGTLVIEEGSLRDLLLLFVVNRQNLRRQPLQKSMRRLYKRFRTLYQNNTLLRSRDNVKHYDLSNDLYRLFLDEDLLYSCAFYEDPADSLEVAQRNKLRHIAAKLDLQPGQKVLDLGCGWGAMSLYMAEVMDVEVLGVTLSSEQHALASQRVSERELRGKVHFQRMDYREVEGTFDRIVSIGMLEHVGIGHHQALFSKIDSLLEPDGVAVLHSIGRRGGPGATSPWLRKYIFPGGYSPAISETLATVEQAGFWVTDIEVLRLHYAKTLEEWERRFQAARAEIADMLDERFCRMWEFYLIACEHGFSHGKQMVFHLQLTKQVDRLPITRDYIAQAKEQLRALELKADLT